MTRLINLDDQSPEELDKIAKEIDEEVAKLNMQRQYISCIAMAKELRAEGAIPSAQFYENIADGVYKKMPADIKW